jgi:hypothetical protein
MKPIREEELREEAIVYLRTSLDGSISCPYGKYTTSLSGYVNLRFIRLYGTMK